MKYIIVFFALCLVFVSSQETIPSRLQQAIEFMKQIADLGNQFPACVASEDVKSYSSIQQALTNCDSSAVVSTAVIDSSQQIPDYCSQNGAELVYSLLAHIQRNIRDCINRNEVPSVYRDDESLNLAKNEVVKKAQSTLNNISTNPECVDYNTQINIVQILNEMENARNNCATNNAKYLDCFHNTIAEADKKVDLITAAIDECLRQSQ